MSIPLSLRKRHHLIGRTLDGDLWVTVERRQLVEGDELSINGVVGPKPSGNSTGGAGQILDELDGEIRLASGWSHDKVLKLRQIWNRWHLNGMRAGCEHQRAERWDERPIDESKPLNAYGVHHPKQTGPTWNMLAWVRPDEVPGGLLGAPCPTCGYRYGSAWVFEEVPQEVWDFLDTLPDAPREHPWSYA